MAQQLTKLNKTLENMSTTKNSETEGAIAERLAEMCQQMQASMGSTKKTSADDRMVALFARLVKSVQEISAQKQEHVNDRVVGQIAELVQSVQTLSQAKPAKSSTAKGGPVQLAAENMDADIGERIVDQLKSLVHSVHTLRMVAEASQGGKKLRG